MPYYVLKLPSAKSKTEKTFVVECQCAPGLVLQVVKPNIFITDIFIPTRQYRNMEKCAYFPSVPKLLNKGAKI